MKVTLIPKGARIEKAEVSAVFLVGFIGEKIVACRNERGWDIPGGHLEEGEEPMDGLRREAEEEAGVYFMGAMPYLKISLPNSLPGESKYRGKYMLFFVSDSCALGEFIPKPDAFERELFNVETFIERYHGDKITLKVLRDLIQKAEEYLGE